LLFVLAVNLDQRRSNARQGLHRGKLAVDEHARASRFRNHAANDQPSGESALRSAIPSSVASPSISKQPLDHGFFRFGTNQLGRCAPAEQQAERAEDYRFCRRRFRPKGR